MRKSQIISIVASLILLVGLYFFAPVKPPKVSTDNTETEVDGTNSDVQPLDIMSFVPIKDAPQYNTIVGDLAKAKWADDAQLTYVAAHHYELAADSARSVQLLYESGVRYADAAVQMNQPEVYSAAKRTLGKAVSVDTGNLDFQVSLAQVYLNEGVDVMTGVQSLLDVVKQNPSHVQANLLLGQFGIISGQYEKALQRLEKVLSLQAENKEALFFAAQACEQSGQTKQAVTYLNRFLKLVEDPRLRTEIVSKIKSLEAI